MEFEFARNKKASKQASKLCRLGAGGQIREKYETARNLTKTRQKVQRQQHKRVLLITKII